MMFHFKTELIPFYDYDIKIKCLKMATMIPFLPEQEAKRKKILYVQVCDV